MIRLLIPLLLLTLVSCNRDEDPIIDNPAPEGLYFPPMESSEWETISTESLGWNAEALPALYDQLENGGTRAFILLKDGKIVLEKYWGKDILNLTSFDKDDVWYWDLAGKTLTAFLVGLAQQ